MNTQSTKDREHTQVLKKYDFFKMLKIVINKNLIQADRKINQPRKYLQLEAKLAKLRLIKIQKLL